MSSSLNSCGKLERMLCNCARVTFELVPCCLRRTLEIKLEIILDECSGQCLVQRLLPCSCSTICRTLKFVLKYASRMISLKPSSNQLPKLGTLYHQRNSIVSGFGASSFLRLMGHQASYTRLCISCRLPETVPSGRVRKVTGQGFILHQPVYYP